MKKRIAKKMIRSGQCPRCKGVVGVSQFDMKTWKRVVNMCHNCFTVAAIHGGNIVMEVDEEMKKALKEMPLTENQTKLSDFLKGKD
jgi:hypothetical protein